MRIQGDQDDRGLKFVSCLGYFVYRGREKGVT